MLVNLRPPLWPEDNIDIYIYIISFSMPCGPLHSARRNYFSIRRLEKKKHSRTKKSVEALKMHIYVTKSREVTRSHAKSRKVTRSHAESREIPWMYSFFEYIHRNVSWILHTFTETVTRSHAKSRRVPNHRPTNPNNVNVLSVGKLGLSSSNASAKAPKPPSNWCPNSCTDNNRLTQGFRKSRPSNEVSHQLL